jgi:hypothetical protein
VLLLLALNQVGIQSPLRAQLKFPESRLFRFNSQDLGPLLLRNKPVPVQQAVIRHKVLAFILSADAFDSNAGTNG